MSITLSGPFRNGPSPAPASEAPSSQEPREAFAAQRLSVGRSLLLATVAETAVRSAERSEALVSSLLPDRSEEARDWAAFLQRVQNLDPAAGLAALRELAAEAPSGESGVVLRELASILRENDPELFADGLLWLGRRHLEDHPQFSHAALQVAGQFPSTAARAQNLLAAAEGRGSFGAQFELQAPRMLRELASPLMIASFGSGIFLSRAASLATLSRFGRFGWGSLVASEGAALAVEVPAMVLSRRFGERLLHGGAGLLAPQDIGHDLLAGYGPFALLRFSGNALNLGAPWLRRHLALQGPVGARAFSGLRFGAELGSLMLGHRLNTALGLEQPTSGAQALYQGLLSLGHMRLSGRIVESLGFASLAPLWEARRSELLNRSRAGIYFGDFGGPELALVAGALRAQAPAPRRQSLLNPEPMFMVKDGGDGPHSPGGGNPAGGPPTRRALILQLFGQNLGEYAQAAENQDTFLGRVARRLQQTLEKPELVQDPNFARALAEMEAELDAVNDHGNIAKRTYTQLKVLLAPRGGEEPALPPEARETVENMGQDEAHRGALTTSLTRMKEIFQQARQFGWSEDLHTQLVAVKNRLNELYRNSSTWKVPGLDRLLKRHDPEAMLQRRQGALLGLAVLNGHETATVRALRDPSAPPSSGSKLELDILHQSILAAARRSWEPEVLDAEILVLASRFGASEESAAAMLQAAAATRRLVESGPRSTDLLDWLTQRQEAHYFADHFLQLKSSRSMNLEPGRGLQQMGVFPDATDYWFTGLQIFLQSKGDGARLTQGLEVARQSRLPGFHPSVAVSLFGAAHGRKNLPPRLWSENLDPEEYLRRALEPQ
ncbi:MAG TPA: hypothetical protein VJR29_03710 [bacterium]|nr:hypothetical protein [bacterium]